MPKGLAVKPTAAAALEYALGFRSPADGVDVVSVTGCVGRPDVFVVLRIRRQRVPGLLGGLRGEA